MALSGTVKVVTKADILFVVDASASMASKEAKLAAGVPALLSRLDALNPPVDYRLAVMTSSVDARYGPCDGLDPHAPVECSAEFGGTGYQCLDSACVAEFPQFAGQLVAAPGNEAVLDRAKLSRAQMEQLFAENIMVGTGGSGQEQPLRGLTIGIKGGGLSGFLRPDARLVVFVASDRDDCSDTSQNLLAYQIEPDGTVVDNCALQSQSNGTLLDSVADWVAWFKALPSSNGPREVAFGAAIGLTAGTGSPGTCVDSICASACATGSQQATCEQQCQGALQVSRCLDQCQQQCVNGCGSQSPGSRLDEAVQLMQGTLASICDSDYGPDLARLAEVVGIPESLAIPTAPVNEDAFFFTVLRKGKTIICSPATDYTLDLKAAPIEMNISQSGACRLLPDDQWSIQYLTQ
jgi:hypothetical protein